MLKNLLLGGMVLFILVSLFLFGGPVLIRTLVDSTVYSPGYSESAFQSIKEGADRGDVIRLLGHPLRSHEGELAVVRWYGPEGSYVDEGGGLHTPPDKDMFAAHIVYFDLTGTKAAQWGNFANQSAEQVEAALGKPIKEKVNRSVIYYRYSRSRNDGSYYRRWIGIDEHGKVAEKVSYFYWD